MMSRQPPNHYVAPSALARFSMPRRVEFPSIKICGSIGNRANYWRLEACFFNLPQVVVVLEVGDTANPNERMSG